MMIKTKRQSNLELLRIFSMLIIIGHHYAIHGVFQDNIPDIAYKAWSAGTQVNKIFTCFLTPGGEVGVALFFMITGYFQISKKKISLKKVVLESSFYGLVAIILTIVAVLGGIVPSYLHLDNLVAEVVLSLFTPSSGGCWWFVSAYVFLILLSPVLNRFLHRLSTTGWGILIIVSWLLWYTIAIAMNADYMQLEKAIFYYSIGAYIRCHNSRRKNRKLAALIALLCWIGYAACSFESANAMLIGGTKGKYIVMLMNAIGTSVFVPIVAVNVFRCFLSLKIKNNDIVNKISATTFGIYLLHDSITARGLIWYRILDLPRQQYMSPLYPLMACLTILVLFAVCSAFDLLRMKMVLPIDRKIDIHILGYKRIIFLKNSNNIGDDGNTENIN